MDSDPLKLSYGDHRLVAHSRIEQPTRNHRIDVYCLVCNAWSSGTFSELDMSMNPTIMDEFIKSIIREFTGNYPASCRDTMVQIIHDS